MKKAIALAIALAIAAPSLGCEKAPTPVSVPNLMDNVTPSGDSEKMSENDKKDANLISTEFAAQLFKHSFDGESNTLISPLSVMSALAMTAGGAENNTLAQFESVLGMSRDALNAYMKAYVDSLPSDEKYRLHLANSIWFTDDGRFTVNEGFLQNNADSYGADIFKAPFDDSTVKDINSWVDHHTDGMIPEVVDSIPADAVMYLVNALAFDAEWSNIYEEHQVRDGEFTNLDGTVSEVQYMRSSEGTYLDDGSAIGFMKYYKGGKYAFAALLPNEGITLGEYVASLDGEHIASLLNNTVGCTVNAKLPKFEYDYSTEMNDILSAMGLTDAFDPYLADFSGIGSSTGGNIFISNVIHKTYISVAERGTKAGAVTVVVAADGAAMEIEQPKYVSLDRPFVYMIIDTENKVPFFIGAVTNLE